MRRLSGRTLVSAILASVAVSGCGDPTSATESTAARLEALSDQVGSDHQDRWMSLRLAARTIRRGAPINRVTIAIDGSQRDFEAVAIQAGFIVAGDTNALTSHMVAWRGTDADELVTIFAQGLAFQFPDTTMPPEDSAVYVGNLNESLRFLRGTTELWRARSGEGTIQPLAASGSCPVREGYFCQRRDLEIDFSVAARTFSGGVQQNHTLEMSKRTVKAIRYLVRCPEVSCSLSMIEDLP